MYAFGVSEVSLKKKLHSMSGITAHQVNAKIQDIMHPYELNYDAIRDYFETATASQQRGKTSEVGLIAYASYLLERIGLTKSKVIGCRMWRRLTHEKNELITA